MYAIVHLVTYVENYSFGREYHAHSGMNISHFWKLGTRFEMKTT